MWEFLSRWVLWLCYKTIAACETVVDRNSTGFTVKCENYCPVECSDAVVRQLLPVKQWFSNCLIAESEYSTGQEFSHLTVKLVEFLSTTVSQTAIVLQQPSEHPTGQEFSHLTVKPSEFLSITVSQNSTCFTVKCENYCPVEVSDGCCKTIAACETVIERNSTGFTVKCENDCPVGCSDGCCKTIAVCEAVVDRNSTGFTLKCENYCPVECSEAVVRQLLKPLEFLSITVSQAAIVLQQPSEYPTGQ
jgi:hypothetical protein